MTHKEERCPKCHGKGAIKQTKEGQTSPAGPAEKGALLCHMCKGFGWVALQTVKLNVGPAPDWMEED